MRELTGKQKRFLRQLGGELRPGVTIGKSGLSGATVQTVFLLLEIHELVKVRLPAGLGKQRKGYAEALAEATQSSCVSLVGRNVLLYRPNRDLDPEKRIALP